MNVLKMIKALLLKGFATAEEKANLAIAVKALDSDEQDIVKEEVAKVEALPTDEPNKVEETKSMLKSLMNESTNEIKAEINAWLKSQEELRAKSAGIYSKEAKPAREELNKKFKNFCMALYGDEAKMKEMSTDATGTPFAGYAVDTELSAEIRHVMTRYGVARREMTNLTLTKNAYKANVLATDVVVYWVDEGAVIKSTQAVLGQKTLELQKLGAIVTLTSELLQDEEIDLFAFLSERIAENLAKAEDMAFFVGDGTATYGGFTGILNDTGCVQVTMPATMTTFASLTADDLLALQDAIPESAELNAKYYFHRTILSVIRKLKSTDKQYIYQAPSANLPATIWNKPYVTTEVLPKVTDTAVSKKFVIYGDLKKACIFAQKGAMEAKRFDSGMVRNVADNADINLITTDREAMRFVERVGSLNIMPSVVAVLKTAAS